MQIRSSRHRRTPSAWALLLATLPFAAAAADANGTAGAREGDEPHLEARLLADPQGDGVWRVGVELVPDPGWHVYWRNPGETGLAPRFDWRLPAGSVGEIAWPVPRAFHDPDADILSYGYDQPVLLATLARTGSGESTLLEVEVDALVCADQCIPGSFALETRLDASRPSDPAVRARFDAAERSLPRPVEEREVEVELRREGGAAPDLLRATLIVHPCGRGASACEVGAAGGNGPAFFPYRSEAADWRASPPRPFGEEAGAFAVDLEATLLEPQSAPDLVGVIPLRDLAGREHSVEVSFSSRASSAAGAGAKPAASSWLRAALLGFLGGLLLNLMPCVLPVLAIKLHSLATLARQSRREHRSHAAAYAAGTCLSMLSLAAVVLGLRAAGTAVGWGFQLQEPIFVLAISALLVVFASNLFGVFEIQVDVSALGRVGRDAPGVTRSFLDGLLAVALATPCSAPFLGTAVGFAFASPAPVIVSIFLAIGAGLASPFVLAALFPAWTRALPRSGAWMADLRGALGFALLLTVVWLLWILGRAAGSDAIVGALLVLLSLAAATWLLGLLQRRGRPFPATATAAVLVGMTVAGIGAVDLSPQPAAPELPIAGTRPFASEGIRESVRAGRPVFVYFTADWCLTCKVNEKRVLTDARVSAELERLGFEVFRGDWTRRDETIRGALAELGKAGVPVYALYAPGSPGRRPMLLPELLTVDGFLQALRRTAGPARAGP